jgi:hypothetical protein
LAVSTTPGSALSPEVNHINKCAITAEPLALARWQTLPSTIDKVGSPHTTLLRNPTVDADILAHLAYVISLTNMHWPID